MLITRLIGFSLVAFSIIAPAQADQVKRSMPACVSEELLDELIGYVNKKDKEGMMQLYVSGKCINLTAGTNVSVISPGFMVTTIRYGGQKLHTPAEAIR